MSRPIPHTAIRALHRVVRHYPLFDGEIGEEGIKECEARGLCVRQHDGAWIPTRIGVETFDRDNDQKTEGWPR